MGFKEKHLKPKHTQTDSMIIYTQRDLHSSKLEDIYTPVN